MTASSSLSSSSTSSPTSSAENTNTTTNSTTAGSPTSSGNSATSGSSTSNRDREERLEREQQTTHETKKEPFTTSSSSLTSRNLTQQLDKNGQHDNLSTKEDNHPLSTVSSNCPTSLQSHQQHHHQHSIIRVQCNPLVIKTSSSSNNEEEDDEKPFGEEQESHHHHRIEFDVKSSNISTTLQHSHHPSHPHHPTPTVSVVNPCQVYHLDYNPSTNPPTTATNLPLLSSSIGPQQPPQPPTQLPPTPTSPYFLHQHNKQNSYQVYDLDYYSTIRPSNHNYQTINKPQLLNIVNYRNTFHHHLPPHPNSGSSSASVIGVPTSFLRSSAHSNQNYNYFNYPNNQVNNVDNCKNHHCHCHHRNRSSPLAPPTSKRVNFFDNNMDRGVGGIENPAMNIQSLYGTTTTTTSSSGNHIRDWGTSTHDSNRDRWETQTAITTATSLHSGGGSFEMDLNLIGKDGHRSSGHLPKSSGHFLEDVDRQIKFRRFCQMYFGMIVSSVVAIVAFISPMLMILLPKFNPKSWSVTSECGPECDGLLISISFKYLLLLIATYLIFARKPRSTYPRVNSSRAAILIINILLIIAYWTFFLQRSIDRKISDYELPFRDLMTNYPIPMLDILIVIHYVAVIWSELRSQRSEFVVKVIRSPDGVSKTYTVGDMSIQRTAVWILERYYTDFPIYNSYIDNIGSNSAKDNGSIRSKKVKNISLDSTVIPIDDDDRNSGLKYFGDVDSGINSNSTNSNTPNSGLHQPGHHYQNTPNGNPPNGLGNISTMAMNGSPATPSSVAHLFRNNNIANNRHKSHSVVGVETSFGTKRSVSGRRHERESKSGHHRSLSREREGHHHHHHHHHHDKDNDRSAHRDMMDRLHEEIEFDRRVKKRKVRLVSNAEEAFNHVKLIGEPDPMVGGHSSVTSSQPQLSMDPRETAQSIFPTMAKSLQKFLRTTRSSNRHTLSSILEHLSISMKYRLSSKAFLEHYFNSIPIVMDEREKSKNVQPWGLVSDVLLSRNIDDGSTFMLRQGQISLLVVVTKLPTFDIEEEVIDSKSNRFVFRINSETSV